METTGTGKWPIQFYFIPSATDFDVLWKKALTTKPKISPQISCKTGTILRKKQLFLWVVTGTVMKYKINYQE